MSLGENLSVALFIMIVALLGYICGNDCGKGSAKEELIQELCSKTEYDFCQKVPQTPIYKLKTEK